MAANQSHQNAQTKQNRVVKSGTHFPCVHDYVLWFYYFRYSGNNGTCQKKSLKLSKLKYWCNRNLDRNHGFY